MAATGITTAALQEKGERGGRKLFIGGISFNTTDEEFYTYFKSYGDLEDCVIIRDKDTGKSRGFGFVTFKDLPVAEAVVKHKELFLDGRRLDPKPSVSRCEQMPAAFQAQDGRAQTTKIFVGGLHEDTTDAEMVAHFSAFGEVSEVNIMYDRFTNAPRRFGFVIFKEASSARAAVECARDQHIVHAKCVECKPAFKEVKAPMHSNRFAPHTPQYAHAHSAAPPSYQPPRPPAMYGGHYAHAQQQQQQYAPPQQQQQQSGYGAPNPGMAAAPYPYYPQYAYPYYGHYAQYAQPANAATNGTVAAAVATNTNAPAMAATAESAAVATDTAAVTAATPSTTGAAATTAAVTAAVPATTTTMANGGYGYGYSGYYAQNMYAHPQHAQPQQPQPQPPQPQYGHYAANANANAHYGYAAPPTAMTAMTAPANGTAIPSSSSSLGAAVAVAAPVGGVPAPVQQKVEIPSAAIPVGVAVSGYGYGPSRGSVATESAKAQRHSAY